MRVAPVGFGYVAVAIDLDVEPLAYKYGEVLWRAAALLLALVEGVYLR